MTVKVKFFAYFREIFGAREREMSLPKSSAVRSLLEEICDTPIRRAEIFDGESLKSQVIVMKNGTPMESPGGLEAELEDGDIVAVFPFVGGG